MEIKAHKRNWTAIYPHTKGEATATQGLSCGFLFNAVWGVYCVVRDCMMRVDRTAGCTMWADVGTVSSLFYYKRFPRTTLYLFNFHAIPSGATNTIKSSVIPSIGAFLCHGWFTILFIVHWQTIIVFQWVDFFLPTDVVASSVHHVLRVKLTDCTVRVFALITHGRLWDFAPWKFHG